MMILWKYLKPQKRLIAVALVLAAISQLLNLVDPIIFGKIIDDFAVNPTYIPENALVTGVLFWLGVAVTVALLARVAKTFQDYFARLAVQQFGMQIYNDGLEQTLRLSYDEFEDQRSGETLSVLLKVRSDTQTFINAFINVLFSTFVGISFLVAYSLTKNWLLVPVFVTGILVLGSFSWALSTKIKTTQREINRETNEISGVITESLRNIELVKSLGLTFPEIRRLRERNLRIFNLEMTDVFPGNYAFDPQAVDTVHPPLVDLPQSPYHGRTGLYAVHHCHHLRTPPGPWHHHRELPGSRSIRE
jgi:ATP-binding cassette subfamily B protein